MMPAQQPHREGANTLLAELSAAEFVTLKPHLKDVFLPQGAVLQEQDAPTERVFFPLQGIVSLVNVMQDGHVVEVANVGHEGVIGASAGTESHRAFSRAIVLIPTTALTIPAAAFQAFVAQTPRMRDLIIAYEEGLLGQIQQTAACNTLHSFEQRLARWLLSTYDRMEHTSIPLTHENISHLLGVRRTTVTLVLQKLQQEGLLHCSRSRIDVVNRPGLEARACECYQVIRRRGATEPASAAGTRDDLLA